MDALTDVNIQIEKVEEKDKISGNEKEQNEANDNSKIGNPEKDDDYYTHVDVRV